MKLDLEMSNIGKVEVSKTPVSYFVNADGNAEKSMSGAATASPRSRPWPWGPGAPPTLRDGRRQRGRRRNRKPGPRRLPERAYTAATAEAGRSVPVPFRDNGQSYRLSGCVRGRPLQSPG